MPIYEYRCKSCAHPFEKFFLSMNRIPKEITCPKCQSIEVQRRMSAPAIRTGEGGGADLDFSEPAAPAKQLLGRKEIEAAQETKRQIRDMAQSGE
jgi:putative FmdB family regulatory protein